MHAFAGGTEHRAARNATRANVARAHRLRRMSLQPHVAVLLADIEPSHHFEGAAASTVLAALLALLRDVAHVLTRPGLLVPNDPDELGHMLAKREGDALSAEACAETLLSAARSATARPGTLRITGKRNRFKVMSVAESEALEVETRLSCVPIRSTNEMALARAPTEHSMATIRVEFRNGAAITAIEQNDDHRVTLLFSNASKRRSKSLSCTISPEMAVRAQQLYELVGEPRGVNRAVDAATPVKFKDGGFHSMPLYVSELMATIMQDAYRIHCLLSAGNVSRGVFVDRCTLHKTKKGHLLKAALHSCSGGCICDYRRKKCDKSSFKRLEFRIEFGGPIDDATEAGSACTRGVHVELWCLHDRDPAAPTQTEGLSVKLPLEKWLRPHVLKLVTHALKLTAHGADVGEVKSAVALNANSLLETLTSRGLLRGGIGNVDIEARNILRNSISVTRDGKKFQPSFKHPKSSAILKTHGHLFTRLKF